MPTVRFVREECDVICQKGENLRAIAIRENIEIYGFKGKLMNCGGYGQCSTCLISVLGNGDHTSLSELTQVEVAKLGPKPLKTRFACQALVQSSVMIITRPNSLPQNIDELVEKALNKRLD